MTAVRDAQTCGDYNRLSSLKGSRHIFRLNLPGKVNLNLPVNPNPNLPGYPRPNKGLEENNLLYEFPKTMAKPAILFGKRAGNFLPAP